jgi:hypothetical protein
VELYLTALCTYTGHFLSQRSKHARNTQKESPTAFACDIQALLPTSGIVRRYDVGTSPVAHEASHIAPSTTPRYRIADLAVRTLAMSVVDCTSIARCAALRSGKAR